MSMLHVQFMPHVHADDACSSPCSTEIDLVMQHGHGHAAWTWTRSMDMDIQHEHGQDMDKEYY
jgi:hypothetical protein